MKQIFNGIVLIAALSLCIGCHGIPANLKTPIGYLRFDKNSTAAILTEAPTLKNENDNIINTNKTEIPPLELRKTPSTEESKLIQIKVLENTKKEEEELILKNKKPKDKENPKKEEEELILKNKKPPKDKENPKSEEKPKPQENNTNDSEKLHNEEEHKFKDSPKDVAQEEINKQSEVWIDFADDFSLLEDRLPDLTDEEFIEINKEGAIPWNFLKSFDVKRTINNEKSIEEKPDKPMEEKPKEMAVQTPIYITVPIIINSHSTLPISLSIGGQNIPLKVPVDNKDSSVVPAPNVKVSSGGAMATPTSNFNKLMNYAELPPRQTNRHRSNIRSKIYARTNNHKVEEFEYNPEPILSIE